MPGYRLLETTRAYALEKLSESGELESVKRCYAKYLRDLAGVGRDAPLTAEWLAAHRSRVAHASAARDRIFAPRGNGAIESRRCH